MFVVVPSDPRLTWYSGPLEAAYRARVVLCAATHGVPAAAYMSHGSEVAAPAGAAPPAVRVPATSAAAPPRTSNAFLACRSRDRTVIIEPAFLIRRSIAAWSPLSGNAAGDGPEAHPDVRVLRGR